MDLIIALITLLVAFWVGTAVEKAHYKEIHHKEREHVHLPAVTSKDIEYVDNIEQTQLVYGSVVISLDYFKRFLAALRNFFGGRIHSYETLLDRGRREAILRMKKRAKEAGYDAVFNMRFVTSGIGQVTRQNGSVGCFEVLAFGTAVKLRK